MAKGIIYVMSTVVPGLIKIGKTGLENFESRMYQLERNGYFNVVGLKREFAIEVNDNDDKEKLLDTIFSKSRVPGSELFALDIDLVIQLLSSLDGKQVYPKDIKKEEVFKHISIEIKEKDDILKLPEGEIVLKRKVKNFGEVNGIGYIRDGKIYVKKGSLCAPVSQQRVPEQRKSALIQNNVLQEDVICTSLSTAGWIVIGKSNNGWKEWKYKNGKSIDEYRITQDEEITDK